MTRDEIIQFLMRAKRATYAGKGAETASSRPSSHDLEYREGDLMYLDTFLGGERFAGEEALSIGDVPYWSMNYLGRVTETSYSGDYLKEALLRVPFEKPFRGPQEFSDGDYTYKCEVSGDFEWFQGYETIEYRGAVIYDCYFHGSTIK